MNKIRLDSIVFNAGTQVRATIDEDHVIGLAEAFTAGDPVPPITLFHDGTAYYIADGFHRFMAAQRLEWREVDADVRPGTKADALWFALSANRANGRNLTLADKKHAIILALQTWPERSSTQVAEHIGCTQQFVSQVKSLVTSSCNQAESQSDIVIGKDGKHYPSVRLSSPTDHPKAAAVMAMLRDGVRVDDIKRACHVGGALVRAVRDSMSVKTSAKPTEKLDTSQTAVKARRERMRELAAQGHTSRQIAALVGLSDKGCANALRAAGIVVIADKVMGRTRHHNPTDILDRIVMDAEHLVADLNLVEVSNLDHAKLSDWIGSLHTSKKSLESFIRKLAREKDRHGEAA